MKVGVVSDSPAITTGFGVVTDQCCRALLEAGHEVTCFGFKDTLANPQRQTYPCPVEPIDPAEDWHPKLRQFVRMVDVDVVWIYIDIYNLEEVMVALGDTPLPPMSLYAIFDGLPAYTRLMKLLGAFRTIVVTTEPAAAYLETEGYPVHSIAPPGADPAVFQRLDRRALRKQAGLDGAFVVGAFGRNTERKQQPRLLRAMQNVVRSEPALDLVMYFHCSARGYWDLADLAERWGVRERVLFAGEIFDETRGCSLRGGLPAVGAQVPRIPPSFGYVERLNLCDLAINVAHSGDFEQVLVEAPACGVPVAATDDGGIMRAALGPGWPLAAEQRTLGNAGQALSFVAIEAIEAAIHIFRADERRRSEAIELGLAHAAQHTWEPMRRKIVAAVEAAAQI